MDGLEILTFGCRLNLVESEMIRRQAQAAGLEDAVIVNSCAVTAEAERKTRQAIRRARHRRPQARIIVTGCAAQIDPSTYAALPEVDQVLGNDAKLSAGSYLSEARVVMTRPPAPALVLEDLPGHARGFVQIQQGCDHRCTFCVIPLGRGPNRSVPIGEILERVRALVAHGYREVVLTGVDITGFGADLPGQPRLGQLVRRLLALVPELPRLRLSSLDPAEIDEDLWRALQEEPRLMPHLHLSLQAGCDLILKRMKRRHSRDDALRLCRRARALRPGIALGADIIAGFPTEDETMFQHTIDLVEEAGLDYLHVFPFSPRPGTPASRMPQVPDTVITERAARARDVGSSRLARSLASRLGRVADILVERGGFGYTEHFAPVRFTSAAAPGDILPMTLTHIEALELHGEAA
ncbi:MAG TPA: tRNA (N(6)-L-threonylcarbamoyladenosine(37)-C(2))-methylthiotransferase MtaB [Stellaceae bacterium]|nr:tRNA (N(6)-L-threonylcarbamoyladenosine(37)-C(2))-methylthiotransferase MtaB [Stellaceae bacterium]